MDPLVALADQIQRVKDDRAPVIQAQMAIILAPLTFMIDKGQNTTEEAIRRIELLRGALVPEDHELAGVVVQTAIDFLRQNGPKEPQAWKPIIHEGGRPTSESDE